MKTHLQPVIPSHRMPKSFMIHCCTFCHRFFLGCDGGVSTFDGFVSRGDPPEKQE